MRHIEPIQGQIYSLRDILTNLRIDDSPTLTFYVEGHLQCVQTSHCTYEQMLANELFANSQWVYERTTDEWIPIFRFASDKDGEGEPNKGTPITALVDMEDYLCPYKRFKQMWVTPKGLPREQFYRKLDDNTIVSMGGERYTLPIFDARGFLIVSGYPID